MISMNDCKNVRAVLVSDYIGKCIRKTYAGKINGTAWRYALDMQCGGFAGRLVDLPSQIVREAMRSARRRVMSFAILFFDIIGAFYAVTLDLVMQTDCSDER